MRGRTQAMLVRMVPLRIRWYVLFRRFGGAEAARRLGIKVGKDCRIYSYNVAAEPWLVEVGDRTTVSSEVLFITHDGATWLFRVTDTDRPFRYAGIRIGSDCFIGARATIMPGVEIGDRCIVAAGSVVHRSVPSGSIVGGNPVKMIGEYDDYQEKVRRSCARTSDMRGNTPCERIDSIVDRRPVPMLVKSLHGIDELAISSGDSSSGPTKASFRSD